MTETAEPAAAAETTIFATKDIEKIIPHRWPFLLVDRIIEWDPEARTMVGIKSVTASEWFFQGHFPGIPIMPGVIQIEALAQTLAVLVTKTRGDQAGVGLFAGLDDVRFKRLVTPGDRLRLEVRADRIGSKFGRGHGRALVNGELACEATLSFIIVPLESLL